MLVGIAESSLTIKSDNKSRIFSFALSVKRAVVKHIAETLLRDGMLKLKLFCSPLA